MVSFSKPFDVVDLGQQNESHPHSYSTTNVGDSTAVPQGANNIANEYDSGLGNSLDKPDAFLALFSNIASGAPPPTSSSNGENSDATNGLFERFVDCLGIACDSNNPEFLAILAQAQSNEDASSISVTPTTASTAASGPDTSTNVPAHKTQQPASRSSSPGAASASDPTFGEGATSGGAKLTRLVSYSSSLASIAAPSPAPEETTSGDAKLGRLVSYSSSLASIAAPSPAPEETTSGDAKLVQLVSYSSSLASIAASSPSSEETAPGDTNSSPKALLALRYSSPARSIASNTTSEGTLSGDAPKTKQAPHSPTPQAVPNPTTERDVLDDGILPPDVSLFTPETNNIDLPNVPRKSEKHSATKKDTKESQATAPIRPVASASSLALPTGAMPVRASDIDILSLIARSSTMRSSAPPPVQFISPSLLWKGPVLPPQCGNNNEKRAKGRGADKGTAKQTAKPKKSSASRSRKTDNKDSTQTSMGTVARPPFIPNQYPNIVAAGPSQVTQTNPPSLYPHQPSFSGNNLETRNYFGPQTPVTRNIQIVNAGYRAQPQQANNMFPFGMDPLQEIFSDASLNSGIYPPSLAYGAGMSFPQMGIASDQPPPAYQDINAFDPSIYPDYANNTNVKRRRILSPGDPAGQGLAHGGGGPPMQPSLMMGNSPAQGFSVAGHSQEQALLDYLVLSGALSATLGASQVQGSPMAGHSQTQPLPTVNDTFLEELLSMSDGSQPQGFPMVGHPQTQAFSMPAGTSQPQVFPMVGHSQTAAPSMTGSGYPVGPFSAPHGPLTQGLPMEHQSHAQTFSTVGSDSPQTLPMQGGSQAQGFSMENDAWIRKKLAESDMGFVADLLMERHNKTATQQNRQYTIDPSALTTSDSAQLPRYSDPVQPPPKAPTPAPKKSTSRGKKRKSPPVSDPNSGTWQGRQLAFDQMTFNGGFSSSAQLQRLQSDAAQSTSGDPVPTASESSEQLTVTDPPHGVDGAEQIPHSSDEADGLLTYICQVDRCGQTVTVKDSLSKDIIQAMTDHKHVDKGPTQGRRLVCGWVNRGIRCPTNLYLTNFPRHVYEIHVQGSGTYCKFCRKAHPKWKDMAKHYRSCIAFLEMGAETRAEELRMLGK
ncbi:hypothetical protein AX15_000453 [Amanita polypyramis BW_CC]|nr:hypothetical protein AX15_000453 [Amanita polypyramis BW_CC]